VVISTVKSGECGSQWAFQLLSTSPYPAIRAGNDGTVLYANEASMPLLEIWRTGIDRKLLYNFSLLSEERSGRKKF